MLSINESSRLPLTWRLFDADSLPTMPQTLRYRIDCESTGRELTGWTEVEPQSATSIVVPATVNVIQNRTNSFELKTITVEADAGTLNAFNESYTWRVKNQFAI